MRFSFIFIIVVGFVCVAGFNLAQTPPANSNNWQAPADASAVPNPEKDNPAAARAGRKLFMVGCATCHTEDGSGKDSQGHNLRSSQTQEQTDGALFWKITHGNQTNGMPPFDSLSETERWDLVRFVRTFKDSDEN